MSFVRTLDPSGAPGIFETLNAELNAAIVEQKRLKAKLEALAASSVEERLPTQEDTRCPSRKRRPARSTPL